jgi:hypothetical protein
MSDTNDNQKLQRALQKLKCALEEKTGFAWTVNSVGSLQSQPVIYSNANMDQMVCLAQDVSSALKKSGKNSYLPFYVFSNVSENGSEYTSLNLIRKNVPALLRAIKTDHGVKNAVRLLKTFIDEHAFQQPVRNVPLVRMFPEAQAAHI